MRTGRHSARGHTGSNEVFERRGRDALRKGYPRVCRESCLALGNQQLDVGVELGRVSDRDGTFPSAG
jgi:hypothetical protein